MSLSDELAIEAAPREGCCKVGRWFDTLSDTDQQDFMQWVDEGRSCRALHRASKRVGCDAGWFTFHAHVSEHLDDVV